MSNLLQLAVSLKMGLAYFTCSNGVTVTVTNVKHISHHVVIHNPVCYLSLFCFCLGDLRLTSEINSFYLASPWFNFVKQHTKNLALFGRIA